MSCCRLFYASCLALGLAGCADDATGTFHLVASGGKEAAEAMIPAAAFSDGYAVRIDSAVLSLTGLTVRTSTGEDARVAITPKLMELVAPRPPRAVTLDDLPARRWNVFGWENGPPTDASELVNDVEPTIVRRMIDRGYSFYFEGALLPPEGALDAEGRALGEIPFEIGFPVTSRYSNCRSGVDRKDGIAVPPNGVAEAEISWHLTHAFFDSYAESAALRAEAWAGAWKGTGALTIEDLAGQRLTRLIGPDGGELKDEAGDDVIYIPGSTGAETLADFVLASRFGHFDGLEGECRTEIQLHRP